MAGSGRPRKADELLIAMYGEAIPIHGLLRDIGRTLREKREEQGLSQKALARLADMAQTQVLRVEKGDTLGQSLRAIAKHAEALGYRTVVTFEKEDEEA